MKKVFFVLMAAAALLCSCGGNKDNGSSGDGTPLSVNFSYTPTAVFAGDEVSFEAEVKGGKSPYTFKWTMGDVVLDLNRVSVKYTFHASGAPVVKLDVTDAAGTTVQKKKVVVVDPPKVQETGNLVLNWVGKMNGYNSKSTAAVADDGSVYSTCRDNKLYKWSSTGASVWVKQIFTPTGSAVNYGTPSVDTDGTIFIGAGTADGQGTLRAYNANGEVKWTFNEWYNSTGAAPAPNCVGPIVAIDASNVYFGCTGSSGIVLSADKATGARNGFLAPAGGARSGILISKNGYINWYGGKYGVFGVSKTALDAGGNSPISQAFRQYGSDLNKSYEGQIALMNIAGVPCVAGIHTTTAGTTRVYAVKAADGTPVCEVVIDDTAEQDQGGVVVDASGNIVASLNYTLGKDNGGIVVVNPTSKQVVARYRVQEKVSGSPAVDAAGNIHFGTESGFYYVVKPNGDNCDLLVKRDIAALVKADARYADSFALLSTAKIWCSPVIGDDGKIYICFTDYATRDNAAAAFGGVVSLSYAGCTGPAASDWPMMGRDRRHTCKQN
ncbi:MAG: PKD domain-containing protein [Bacteroidales bacterium]|nr:PKD domain-containing protein [Bacteroidales bacterium]